MTFITFWLLGDKEKIHTFVWIIVVSIGFYGVKGGFFTLMTGGGTHVLGPRGGFIAGNTEIGLALVMVYPLVWYLYLNTKHYWIRVGLIISLILIPVGILGTQSRGALLAIIAMTAFLWLKSRHKLPLVVAIMVLAPLLFMFMPQTWHDRMDSLKDPTTDRSAMGRLQAWELATKMALARPLVGGGFESFTEKNYERYTPDIITKGNSFYDTAVASGQYHDVHSIYFEVLGEHGFVGLGIFLTLYLLSWRIANKIIKICKSTNENKWAFDLASMIQVSIIGYAVGGAFLGLAYFDLPYHLMAILVLVLRIVETKPLTDPK